MKFDKHACDNCGSLTSNRRFCSRRCSAAVTNREVPKRTGCFGSTSEINCSWCSKPTVKRNAAIRASRRKGKRLFCSVSCAGKSNIGIARPRLRKETKFQRCIGCLNNFYVKLSDGKKYCSRICYRLHKNRLAYEEFVPLWLAGDTVMTQRGSKGQISGHIRRYLFEKYDSKCVVCSWSKIHPTTGKVPLAVDHENGDWKDNREVNLRLLCPNCHSLTSTYGSLNKGHGRPR